MAPVRIPPLRRGLGWLAAVLALPFGTLAQTGAPTFSQNQGIRPVGPNPQPAPGPPGVTLFAYGPTAGDLSVARSDDGSTDIAGNGSALRGLGPEGSSLVINFGGTAYKNIYANVNGIVTFGSTLSSYTPQSFVESSHSAPLPPMLAPYWADADIRLGGNQSVHPSGNVWYRTTTDAVQLAAITARIESAYAGVQNFTPTVAQIVTWDKVGRYGDSAGPDNTRVNTFQAVIASNGIETYTIYLYPKDGIWWERGAVTPSNQYPSAGYYANDDNYTNLPGSLTPATRDLWFGTNTADDQKGAFIFDVGGTLPTTVVNRTFTATGSATSELRFRPNPAGHTVTGATAADSILFGKLRFDNPDNQATFTNWVVALAAQPDAITEGNLTFADNSVLVASSPGALNGGHLTLTDNARLALYAADTGTGGTSLTFTGPNTRLEMRGFSTAIGSLNSLLGGGTVMNSAANPVTLTLNSASDGYFTGKLQLGSGALVKDGTGTQILSGNNNYSGTTTVAGGILQFGRTSAFYGGTINATTAAQLTVQSGGTAAFNVGGTQEFTSAQISTLLSHATFLGGTLGLDTTNAPGGHFTLADNLTGALGLTKLGAGTLTLTGVNSYTGVTTVHRGALAFNYSPTLKDFSGPGGTLLVASGQTVTLNQTADQTFAGGIGGAGAVIKTSDHVFTLTGDSTFTGLTTIAAGTLNIGNGGTSGTYAGNISIAAGGALLFARSDESLYAGGLSGGGSVTKLGAGALILTGVNTHTGGTTVSAGTLQIGAGGASGSLAHDVSVLNNATLAFNRADNVTFSANISGAGSVAKLGAGTLALTGANTHTGTTTVAAGTLQIGVGGASGSLAHDVTVLNSATLAFNRADDVTFSANINGAGSIVQRGAGTLTLTGANTHTGGTTVSAGSLRFTAAKAFYHGAIDQTRAGNLSVLSGGAALFDAGGTGGFTSAQLSTLLTYARVAPSGASTLGIDTSGASGAFTLSDNLSNSNARIAMFGTGELVLASEVSSHTFSVSDGALRLAAANRIADTTAMSISAGAAFNLNGFSDTIGSLDGAGNVTLGSGTLSVGANNASTTFSGVVSGSGGLAKSGTGTLTLSGVNSYTGATTVSSGTLRLSGSGQLARTSALSVVSNATFDLGGVSASVGSLAGAGNVMLGSGTLSVGANNASTTFSGSLSGNGGFIKSGTGALTFTGVNSYAGDTTVSGGVLQIGNGGVLGSLGGNITNNASLVFNRFDALTYANTISGTGTVTKLGAGSLAFASDHTYTGSTTISAGTLILGTGGTTGSLAGDIVNHGALAVHRADNVSLDNAISGTGTFTKLGVNILTLTGANTHTGTTTISAGTLQVGDGGTTGSLAGAIVNQGVLAVHRADNISFGNVISGTGDFNKLGANTLTLTGANTYTGTTTISAGTLTLGASQRIADTSALTVAAGATFNLANFVEAIGSLSGAGNITLGSGRLTTGTNPESTTFSGVISGSGSFNKIGSGTLTLTNANTYTGGTTLSGGSTLISSNANLGGAAGSVIFNGGTLATTASFTSARSTTLGTGGGTFDVATDTTLAWNGGLSGSGALTKTGGGSLTLQGGQRSSGSLYVAAGSLNASALTTGAVTVDADAALYLNQANVGSLSGAGQAWFLGANVIGLDNTSTTFSGVFANSATSLTKRGTGTLTLSGTTVSDSSAGSLTLEAGVVRLDSSSVLSRSLLTLAGGALEFGSITRASLLGLSGNGSLNLTNRDGLGVALTLGWAGYPAHSSYSGVLSGSGSLTVAIGNASTYLSGANTYSGGTTIADASQLVLSDAGTLGAASNPLTFTGTGHLLLRDTHQTVGNLTGTGGTISNGGNNGSTFTIGHGNATGGNFQGVIVDRVTGGNGTLALVKTGAGTLTLSGANTYTGGTAINAGTLQIGHGGATGSITGNVAVNSGGTLAFNRSDAASFAGIISGEGSLTKLGAGTLTLTGHNTYTGTTTVSAGTLRIGGGGASGSLAGNVALAAGTALVFNRSDDSAFAGIISGAGSLTKLGTGTLTLSGNNTHTGGTTVDAGTLVASRTGEKGTFATGSTVTVNSSGTLVVNGDSLGWGNGAARLVVNGGTVTSSSTTGLHTTFRDITLAGGLVTTSGNGRFLLNGPLTTQASASTATIDTRLELLANAVNPTVFTIASGSTASGIDLDITGVVHGTGALVKNGAGVLRLGAVNTYTGATAVNAGSLFVNGSLASTSVIVASGATFGGSGSIQGLTTLLSGAHLAAGNSPGTLTFTGGLALNTGAILDFELGTGSDLIRVSGGTLTGSSGTGGTTINLADSGGFIDGTYTLIDFTGATLSDFDAADFKLGTTLDGFTYAFALNGSLLQLTASAVPEPATFAALAGLAGLTLAAGRRRRS